MSKIFIGIDNGVSGSLGFIFPNKEASFFPTPIKKELNYTKVKKWINRIDTIALKCMLEQQLNNSSDVLVGLERPMVNPGRFGATISAIRALEATLIVIEEFDLPHRYIDSKEWAAQLLPKGLEKEELKKASSEIAGRLFPHLKKHFKKDGDSILIAEYLRQKELNPRTL